MKFCSGGHYFACTQKLDPKSHHSKIHLHNSYTLELLHTFTLNTTEKLLRQVGFSDKDLAMIAVGHYGYYGRWSLPSFEKVYETKYPYQTSGDRDHVPEAAKNPEMEQYIALNKSEFEGLDYNGIDVISLSYAEA